MTEAEKLVKALDRAFKMEITDKTLNFEDEFKVAPQVGAGKSVWAPWVRKKVIKPYHCLWAFRDTDPKQWLAVRVEIPFKDFKFSESPKEDGPSSEKTFYFNLQNSTDRWRLKQLEGELTTFLASTN
jgi:hypothetical protein